MDLPVRPCRASTPCTWDSYQVGYLTSHEAYCLWVGNHSGHNLHTRGCGDMKMKGQPNRDSNPVPSSQGRNQATNWANEAGSTKPRDHSHYHRNSQTTRVLMTIDLQILRQSTRDIPWIMQEFLTLCVGCGGHLKQFASFLILNIE